MNLYGLVGLQDFNRDSVFQVIYDPGALVLLVLLEADGVNRLRKLVDGKLEVDTRTCVQFTCFLKGVYLNRFASLESYRKSQNLALDWPPTYRS